MNKTAHSWLCLLAAALGSTSASACEVIAEHAWIRLAPPNAPVMAAYVNLRNPGEQSAPLTAASSADFERVEMHQMSMDGGVMQMRKLDMIEVKVGQTRELKPGGDHLMLYGAKRPLQLGDKVTLTLTLCPEKTQDVEFTVLEQAPEGAPQGDHEHHDHHQHAHAH
jgi:copper(I)-binding protein